MNNKIYSRVFGLLFLGIFTSFLTGYFLYLNPNIIFNVLSGNLFIIVILLELAIAFVFGLLINKINTFLAYLLYISYSITTGFTISLLFLTYNLSSIIYIFMITSIILLGCSIIGMKLKSSLNKLGTYLIIALVAVLLTSIVNIFIGSNTLNFIVSIFGVLIFTLFIVYDVNKILLYSDYLEEKKGAIYCAFQIYLDFINILFSLLNLFGIKKDN